jgi:hypothetical protein
MEMEAMSIMEPCGEWEGHSEPAEANSEQGYLPPWGGASLR